MSKKSKRNRRSDESAGDPARVRPKWLSWSIAGAAAVLALGALALLPPKTSRAIRPDVNSGDGNFPAPDAGDSPSAGASAKSIDPQRLIGRWLRPDGGYILEIRDATVSEQADQGKLEAGYFNPNPIHVARAEWRREDGNLQVFVELRDVNYPGSTYTMEYSADEDRMAGNYYQAAQREDFAVEFVREK